MFNNLIGKNKELGRFLLCERYTLPPVKNAMYIAEGQDLKRGAVVDVNGVLVGTNSLMPYAVLEFDCDTRNGGKQASVFINGEFNFDKLTFVSGLSKSDMDNIVYNGSDLGIVIKPYEYEEGFSPVTVDNINTHLNVLQEQVDNIEEKAGSGYTPKGPASVATLNGLTGQENGWLYTMTDAGTLTDGSVAVVAGDSVAWDDTNSVWYKAMNYAPAQYGTNEVHNLTTSITAFRTGDVIPVDGPSGTAKMSKDNLLTETAQNALAGNVAPAFDPTRTSENPYKAGESVAYEGKTYTFKVDHYGSWAAADVQQVPSVETKLSKGSALVKTASTTMDKYNGGLGTSAFFNGGQHVALPIKAGDILKLVPKSKTAGGGNFAFVTSDYVPGDHASGSIPFCSGTGRGLVNVSTTGTAVAPADAAYILLATIDGGSNRLFWDISKSVEPAEFASLFGGKEIPKDYFVENVSPDQFLVYSGIVGTSTIWINSGKHIAIPVCPGDTIKIKPSISANFLFVTSSYVPGDHTSGQVEFAVQNIGRDVASAGTSTEITAGVDARYLILHVVDGGGNKVAWEIKKTISQQTGDKVLGLLEGHKCFVSLDALVTYKGGLSASGTWFIGTNVSHKALPVMPGEKYTISIPTNYGGSFAVVTSDYVPGDHTSGSVSFAGFATNRTVINGNTSIDVVVPADGAYIIFTVHDGGNMGVVYSVEKWTLDPLNLGTFQKLRYAHWNIGHFSMGTTDHTTITPEQKAEKQAAYRQFINSIHPDVLGVCEDDPYFATDDTPSSSAVYSCFSQQHLGLKVSYVMNSIYSNGLKILQFSWQSFPEAIAAGYQFSEMLVELDGDLVVMCETHLTWQNYEKRTAQIQYLIDRYAPVKYVIIAADWNIGPNNGGPSEETEMAPLVAAGYRMSMMDYMPRESTYSGNDVTPASDSALDIICAKGFGLINAHVSQDCASLSDHRLVYCDLIKNP